MPAVSRHNLVLIGSAEASQASPAGSASIKIFCAPTAKGNVSPHQAMAAACNTWLNGSKEISLPRNTPGLLLALALAIFVIGGGSASDGARANQDDRPP